MNTDRKRIFSQTSSTDRQSKSIKSGAAKLKLRIPAIVQPTLATVYASKLQKISEKQELESKAQLWLKP